MPGTKKVQAFALDRERTCLNVGFLECFVVTSPLVVIVLLAEAVGLWIEKKQPKQNKTQASVF